MRRIISFSACFVMALVLIISPVEKGLQAQQIEPVKFNFAGDSKFKNEDGKYYIYIYCNKYEGTTCTMPDGAVRLQIPKISAGLLPFKWND